MKSYWTLVLAIFLPFLGFGQKAFEAVYYKGKLKGMELHFKLADGFLSASEIISKDLTTGTKTRYVPDNGIPDPQGSISFHEVEAVKNKTDFFSVRGLKEAFGKTVPNQLELVYHSKGQKIRFPLKKVK